MALLTLGFGVFATEVQVIPRTVTSGPIVNRACTVTLTVPQGAVTAGPWAIAGDSVTLYTGPDGTCTFSNMLMIGEYRLDIHGNPSRSFPFNVAVTNGYFNIIQLLGTNNPPPEMFYDTVQIDSMIRGITNGAGGGPFLLRSGGNGTNETLWWPYAIFYDIVQGGPTNGIGLQWVRNDGTSSNWVFYLNYSDLWVGSTNIYFYNGAALNGGNLAGSTNLALTGLQQGGATNTASLVWNGTAWVPGAPPGSSTGISAQTATNIAAYQTLLGTNNMSWLPLTNSTDTWYLPQTWRGASNSFYGTDLDFHRPNVSTLSEIRYIRDNDLSAGHYVAVGMDPGASSGTWRVFDSLLNSNIISVAIDGGPGVAGRVKIGGATYVGIDPTSQLLIVDNDTGISQSLSLASFKNGVLYEPLSSSGADGFIIARPATTGSWWYRTTGTDTTRDWRWGQPTNSQDLVFYSANGSASSPYVPGLEVFRLKTGAGISWAGQAVGDASGITAWPVTITNTLDTIVDVNAKVTGASTNRTLVASGAPGLVTTNTTTGPTLYTVNQQTFGQVTGGAVNGSASNQLFTVNAGSTLYPTNGGTIIANLATNVPSGGHLGNLLITTNGNEAEIFGPSGFTPALDFESGWGAIGTLVSVGDFAIGVSGGSGGHFTNQAWTTAGVLTNTSTGYVNTSPFLPPNLMGTNTVNLAGTNIGMYSNWVNGVTTYTIYSTADINDAILASATNVLTLSNNGVALKVYVDAATNQLAKANTNQWDPLGTALNATNGLNAAWLTIIGNGTNKTYVAVAANMTATTNFPGAGVTLYTLSANADVTSAMLQSATNTTTMANNGVALKTYADNATNQLAIANTNHWDPLGAALTATNQLAIANTNLWDVLGAALTATNQLAIVNSNRWDPLGTALTATNQLAIANTNQWDPKGAALTATNQLAVSNTNQFQAKIPTVADGWVAVQSNGVWVASRNGGMLTNTTGGSGGISTFDQLGGGISTLQTFTVGNSSKVVLSGSGIVQANIVSGLQTNSTTGNSTTATTATNVPSGGFIGLEQVTVLPSSVGTRLLATNADLSFIEYPTASLQTGAPFYAQGASNWFKADVNVGGTLYVSSMNVSDEWVTNFHGIFGSTNLANGGNAGDMLMRVNETNGMAFAPVNSKLTNTITTGNGTATMDMLKPRALLATNANITISLANVPTSNDLMSTLILTNSGAAATTFQVTLSGFWVMTNGVPTTTFLVTNNNAKYQRVALSVDCYAGIFTNAAIYNIYGP